MCDHLYRLDAQIGTFLTFLDGLGPRVLVVMTGDHGGSDFVERRVLRGFANARRIDSKALLTAVNDDLKSKFSLTADPLVTPDFAQFYAVDDKKRALGEPPKLDPLLHSAIGSDPQSLQDCVVIPSAVEMSCYFPFFIQPGGVVG
jgi:hypothetical protein